MRFLAALVGSFVLGSLAAPFAQAFDAKMISYSIEPIVGYELERKSEPQPHAKLTLVYGARVVAGYHLLSAEAEYTRGSSDEEYPSSSLRIEQLTQNYRLGLRSQPRILPGLSLVLRGGAELHQVHTKTTSYGLVSEGDSPGKVRPYVGAGLGFHLGMQVSLTAEGLMSVNDWQDLKQNEYTGTVGLKIALNTH